MTDYELILEEKIRYALYGMLVFLTLFMFIQYLQNQRKSFYIYYALFVLDILLAFEPHLTPVTNAYIHLIEWPGVFLYFLFLNSFLDLSRESWYFARFFRYFKKGFVVVLLVQTSLIYVKENGWFFDTLEWFTHLMDDAFFYFSYIASAFTIVEVFRLRNTLSYYIITGMFFLTAGLVINRIFYNEFGIFPIWIGLFVDLLVFSSAIGYKTWLTEKEKGKVQKEMLKATLVSLREQMNPHFISNCLNSIKRLIQKGEGEQAIDYLTRFSKLHRLVVANFRHQKIPLSRELAICRYYLEMEKLRFKESFQYEVDVRANEDMVSFVEIPPLLLQPFLENAIWHGLLPKKGAKRLQLIVEPGDGSLRCVIEDNGVGWKSSAIPAVDGIAGEKKSTGIANAREKLKIFRELYDIPISLNIIDKTDKYGNSQGVRVEFLIQHHS